MKDINTEIGDRPTKIIGKLAKESFENGSKEVRQKSIQEIIDSLDTRIKYPRFDK